MMLQPSSAIRMHTNTHPAAKDYLVLSHASTFFLYATVVYLVVPIVNIPFVGLSPSAIFIALVALEVFLGNKNLQLGDLAFWAILLYLLWLGYSLSLAANIITGSILSTSQLIWLVRSAFWFLSFITTLVVIYRSSTFHIALLIQVAGISAILLGGVRLWEAVYFGRWGASSSAIFSQNNYGILFSRFAPFALILPFMLTGLKRGIVSLGVGLLLFAIVINGSRSSWVAGMANLVVFSIVFIFAQPKRSTNLLWIIPIALASLTIAISALPVSVIEPISDRFATLEKVEEDKSFATRQLMIQKSQKLFEEHPIFGVGIGQFSTTQADLDIPYILSGSPRDFNTVASHNSYARLLAEAGLVGVVPFAILQVTLLFGGFWSTIALARKGEVWAIAVYTSFIGMSIHQWTIDNLNNTSPWFIYGFLAAIIVRANQLPKAN